MAATKSKIELLFSFIITSFMLSTVALLLHPRSPVPTSPDTQSPRRDLRVMERRNLHESQQYKTQLVHIGKRKLNKKSHLQSQLLRKELDLDLHVNSDIYDNSTENKLNLPNDTKQLNVTYMFLVGRTSAPHRPMDIAKIIAMFAFMNNGRYVPSTHTPLQRVAILIPYRNRRPHLYTLLPVLIPLLMRQNIEFGIFVVELDAPTAFNKGVLFNAGFQEIMKTHDYECVILHDVDLLPVDDRNLYRCNKNHPIHFTANIIDFKQYYNGLFGGVVGFTPQQFRAINGASNVYFGWGGEDDDLRDRVLGNNFTIVRKPSKFAVYKMISHGRKGYWKENPNRFRVFASRRERWKYDGLNSLAYNVTRMTNRKVLTWINIAVDATKIVESIPKYIRARKDQDFHIDVDKGIINL